MSQITSFLGEHFYLSNFYHYKPFEYDGFTWQTSEHAFQAVKCSDYKSWKWWRDVRKGCGYEPRSLQSDRTHKAATPREAKTLGRQCKMREDWEEIKERVMFDVLWSKFYPGSELSQRLQATGDAELIEGNNYGDRTWGCVDYQGGWAGKNKLGKILMAIRELQR